MWLPMDLRDERKLGKCVACKIRGRFLSPISLRILSLFFTFFFLLFLFTSFFLFLFYSFPLPPNSVFIFLILCYLNFIFILSLLSSNSSFFLSPLFILIFIHKRLLLSSPLLSFFVTWSALPLLFLFSSPFSSSLSCNLFLLLSPLPPPQPRSVTSFTCLLFPFLLLVPVLIFLQPSEGQISILGFLLIARLHDALSPGKAKAF